MPDAIQLTNFFLVFLRAAAFLTAGPLYAFRGVPTVVRVGFPFALAAVLFPLMEKLPEAPANVWNYGLAAASEIVVGLMMGFTVTVILNSIRLAGQLIDLKIGFIMSAMADPMSGNQTTLLAQFMNFMALVLFLVMDGHHLMILGLIKSYEMIPLGMANISGAVGFHLVETFNGAMSMAMRIAAPVLAVLLICDLALGFLSRTTPQINVFLTGFLVKIIVGMLVLAFLMPFMGTMMQTLIGIIEHDLYTLMRALM